MTPLTRNGFFDEVSAGVSLASVKRATCFPTTEYFIPVPFRTAVITWSMLSLSTLTVTFTEVSTVRLLKANL